MNVTVNAYRRKHSVAIAHLGRIKEALRSKYAWPGGYPLYLVCSDGESLSIDAARENYKEIARAHISGDRHSSWRIAGVDINYEEDLICAHSGEIIERAYPAD